MRLVPLYTKDTNTLKEIIFEKIGFRLDDCLLEQAFTRKSYTAKNGGENNDILEHIGDKVLDYFVVKILSQKLGALNRNCMFALRATAGDLSKTREALVKNETLAKIIDEWRLFDYVIVGKCDVDNEIDKEVKPKADLFEAIIGAIAIRSKWNAEILEEVVKKVLKVDTFIQELLSVQYRPEDCSLETAVTTLKELAEKGYCSIYKTDFLGPEALGYDINGNPIWSYTYSVVDEIRGITKSVYASSKKLAKKAAAYLVLCEHFELQNEYGTNGNFIEWEFVDGKLLRSHESKFYTKH